MTDEVRQETMDQLFEEVEEVKSSLERLHEKIEEIKKSLDLNYLLARASS